MQFSRKDVASSVIMNFTMFSPLENHIWFSLYFQTLILFTTKGKKKKKIVKVSDCCI